MGRNARRRRSDIAAANVPMHDAVSGDCPFRPGCREQRPPRYAVAAMTPASPKAAARGGARSIRKPAEAAAISNGDSRGSTRCAVRP